MVDIAVFTKMAMDFPGTEEKPHFEKSSFRVKNKIFATLDVPGMKACLKLSAIDQSVFSAIDSSIIYPVANKWGKQGWTIIELQNVRKNILKEALAKAHAGIASKTSFIKNNT